MTDPKPETPSLEALLMDWESADNSGYAHPGYAAADEMANRLRAVAEIHVQGKGRSAYLCWGCDLSWPCRTRRALDGER